MFADAHASSKFADEFIAWLPWGSQPRNVLLFESRAKYLKLDKPGAAAGATALAAMESTHRNRVATLKKQHKAGKVTGSLVLDALEGRNVNDVSSKYDGYVLKPVITLVGDESTSKDVGCGAGGGDDTFSIWLYQVKKT